MKAEATQRRLKSTINKCIKATHDQIPDPDTIGDTLALLLISDVPRGRQDLDDINEFIEHDLKSTISLISVGRYAQAYVEIYNSLHRKLNFWLAKLLPELESPHDISHLSFPLSLSQIGDLLVKDFGIHSTYRALLNRLESTRDALLIRDHKLMKKRFPHFDPYAISPTGPELSLSELLNTLANSIRLVLLLDVPVWA